MLTIALTLQNVSDSLETSQHSCLRKIVPALLCRGEDQNQINLFCIGKLPVQFSSLFKGEISALHEHMSACFIVIRRHGGFIVIGHYAGGSLINQFYIATLKRDIFDIVLLRIKTPN